MAASIADYGKGQGAAAGDRGLLIFILIGAIFVRLIWLTHVHGGLIVFVERGEATLEAMAVAQTGSFADAYCAGCGPTAHLLPIFPMIAGGLLRVFGVGTAIGNLALLTWSLAQVIVGWLLMRHLFARLGSDHRAIKLGTVIVAMVPVFVPQEVVDFRWREGALAACLACLNLIVILRYENIGTSRFRDLILAAILWAVTAFVNPTTGLATAACWGIFALRSLPLPRAALFATISAASLSMLIVPWAIRNDRVLGSPVLLRSNFGLEIALANYDGAVTSVKEPQFAFRDRLHAIHPYHAATARTALASAGGEVAYSRALGDKTKQWIATHPGDFGLLSLRHLSDFFFPRPWQMNFSGWLELRAPRAFVITIVDLLGLAGLALGLWQRRRGYEILATYIVLSALPYAIVQPIPRYTFLVYGLFAFLAAELLVQIAGKLRWAR